jgi:CBS domain-containing protein
MIADVMTPIPVVLDPRTMIREAALVMQRSDVGAVPVVEAGRLCGFVTDHDIVVRAVANGMDPATTPLSDLVSDLVFVVRPDQPAAAALALMGQHALRRLPVVDDTGALVGMVSLGDIVLDR